MNIIMRFHQCVVTETITCYKEQYLASKRVQMVRVTLLHHHIHQDSTSTYSHTNT